MKQIVLMVTLAAALWGCRTELAGEEDREPGCAACPTPPTCPPAPLPPECPICTDPSHAPPHIAFLGPSHSAVSQWVFFEPMPPWTFVGFSAIDWTVPDTGGSVTVPGAMPGDTIVVSARALVELVGDSGEDAAIRLAYAPERSRSPVTIAGAEASATARAPLWSLLTMTGVVKIDEASDVRIWVEGRVGAPGDVLRIQSSAAVAAFHFHPPDYGTAR